MQIGSLKLGERIIKDEKMVVCLPNAVSGCLISTNRPALVIIHNKTLFHPFSGCLNLTGSLKRLIPALLYFGLPLPPQKAA